MKEFPNQYKNFIEDNKHFLQLVSIIDFLNKKHDKYILKDKDNIRYSYINNHE